MKTGAALEKADIKAFLGPGSRFEGKLSFNEVVRLDGVFIGEIDSSDILIIGESGDIDGTIKVGTLYLSGQFSGKIEATEYVELRAPAKVMGEIKTPQLKIERAVVFNGQIIMTDSSSTTINEG